VHAPPLLATCCPWCGLEVAAFIVGDEVDVSHAEPECEGFREFCKVEGFEVVGLADAIPESR
jgi:hypothetical protein